MSGLQIFSAEALQQPTYLPRYQSRLCTSQVECDRVLNTVLHATSLTLLPDGARFLTWIQNHYIYVEIRCTYIFCVYADFAFWKHELGIPKAGMSFIYIYVLFFQTSLAPDNDKLCKLHTLAHARCIGTLRLVYKELTYLASIEACYSQLVYKELTLARARCTVSLN